MNAQHAPTETAVKSDAPAFTTIGGRWLLIARLAWAAMATVTVVLFIAGIPPLFTELRTVCSGTTCDYLRLNPHTIR